MTRKRWKGFSRMLLACRAQAHPKQAEEPRKQGVGVGEGVGEEEVLVPKKLLRHHQKLRRSRLQRCYGRRNGKDLPAILLH
jgi:hypothetical protein